MSLAIARASLADLDDLAALFDGYRQFYGQPADRARAAAFLRARLQADESVVFLARDGGAAVGFTQLYPLWSSVQTGRAWLLNDLFVAPHSRGRGVARALLDAAREHGRATGARYLQLETARDNAEAQRLYEAHGWTRDEAMHTYHLAL
ncbi:MAG: GNAT family N-acetyltransferase [Mizugakiibacter sp.]|uniref:GNAT family N-acetyltransferase n=1 Tax=Mizugakiibacter sp. TaxID=1972610 RepID=UPI0031C0BFCF|nr:GNAT family N-acetyltransferase [Xanthomonadaceae bacterium]